ncbi:copper fist DNA binding domain-containing protein [Xylogone sp. PMI_703]|nr:copper fist DNA binding domain-containing protein [Xylogone sp. PMI_703]
MMLIDGMKWACEICIRGHRASKCNHIDRPLKFIQKKGRPRSHCSYCRVLREFHSIHIQCRHLK